jgi:hypothetical protein
MDSGQEYRVKTWNELQDRLFEDSWRPELQRFRSPYAFRGHQDSNHDLKTSLMRLGGNYQELERHLLRNFRKYARHDQVVQDDTIWNWLSLAKHHGLPTRLLDWSFSPLVAMHFATSDTGKFHLDGAIWALNFVQIHGFLPETLQEDLAAEGSGVITVEILAKAAQSLEDLEKLSDQDFVLFFEPPSIDGRITNQFALFSMMSRAESSLENWIRERPDCWRKIIIPAELKWEIRDKLDQANITERVLFPGVDGLCAWLKRHYSQKS